MKFETKYSLDDEVWVMYKNKVTKITIVAIQIFCSKIEGTLINYRGSNGDVYKEQQIFTSKEKLIAYL